jgi:conjugal transfer pilus assembly protein TraB
MIDQLKDKWETLTPKHKQLSFLGGIAGVIIIAVFAGSSEPPPKVARPDANTIELIEKNTGSMDMEQLVGQNQLLSNKVTSLQAKLDTMDENFKSVKRTLSLNSELAETPQILYDMQRQLELVKKEQDRIKDFGAMGKREYIADDVDIIDQIISGEGEETGEETGEKKPPVTVVKPSLNDDVFSDTSKKSRHIPKNNDIPNDPLAYVNAAYKKNDDVDETENQYITGEETTDQSGKLEKGGAIEIIESEAPIDTNKDKKEEEKWVGAVLPAGTLIPGIVISGVDAPTGKAAEKGAVASTMRITGPAILPNGERVDLTGCFVVHDVRGDLATQRANFRPRILTCDLGDIGIVDTPIQGYVSGKDGTQGFRGRVINKQGEALLYSAASGIIGGFGNAFSGGSSTNSITSGGQFALPSTEEALTSGVGTGISDASDTLAEYYKEQLDLLYPVIEIKPMIFGSIHIIQTIQLKLFKAKS